MAKLSSPKVDLQDHCLHIIMERTGSDQMKVIQRHCCKDRAVPYLRVEPLEITLAFSFFRNKDNFKSNQNHSFIYEIKWRVKIRIKANCYKSNDLLDVVISLLVIMHIKEDLHNLKLNWLLTFFENLYKIQSNQTKFLPNKL